MDAFKKACAQSVKGIFLNPPAMEEVWDPHVQRDLLRATEAALQAGCDAAALYQMIERVRPEHEPFPPKIEGLLFERLGPDTLLSDGTPLLHCLLQQDYPRE